MSDFRRIFSTVLVGFTLLLLTVYVFIPEREAEVIYVTGARHNVEVPDISLEDSRDVSLPNNVEEIRQRVYTSPEIRRLSEQIPVKLIPNKALQRAEGITVLFYIDKTDAVVSCSDSSVSTVYNAYGASYPILYFPNGIPSNSKELYKLLVSKTGYMVGTVDYIKNNKISINKEVYKF